MKLVKAIGVNTLIAELADHIERDFRRWPEFDAAARLASHSGHGVIELMPAADGELYGVKMVNGHPGNTGRGLQTVVALGVLASVDTGYPLFISEMTLPTALRTAATSALAAKYLARPGSGTMALIGLGAQSEFQAIAFREILGVREIRAFDVDPAAAEKFRSNLTGFDLDVVLVKDAAEATLGADIITTVTADKRHANVLSSNLVGRGVHINAVGGDCPGKTELSPDILERASVFVEFAEQTRIEGEIQQMPPDFPVAELWRVIGGALPGRVSDMQITLFDSVGFAIEDFSTLNYFYGRARDMALCADIDLISSPQNPKDLFSLVRRAPQVSETV